jgi:tetratricopeptide (TPR) repeat protein
VRGALSDGEALRVFHPRVRTVVFKPWPEPEDTSSTIVAYRIDGHLEVSDYATFVGVADLGAPATLAEHLERARTFILRRLFREAQAELLAAQTLAPDSPDVLINLGVLQATLGDDTAAVTTLTRAATVQPHDPEVLYNLGLIQWRLDRKADARRTWDRLLREAPESDLAKDVRRMLAGQAR